MTLPFAKGAEQLEAPRRLGHAARGPPSAAPHAHACCSTRPAARLTVDRGSEPARCAGLLKCNGQDINKKSTVRKNRSAGRMHAGTRLDLGPPALRSPPLPNASVHATGTSSSSTASWPPPPPGAWCVAHQGAVGPPRSPQARRHKRSLVPVPTAPAGHAGAAGQQAARHVPGLPARPAQALWHAALPTEQVRLATRTPPHACRAALSTQQQGGRGRSSERVRRRALPAILPPQVHGAAHGRHGGRAVRGRV